MAVVGALFVTSVQTVKSDKCVDRLCVQTMDRDEPVFSTPMRAETYRGIMIVKLQA